MYASDYMVLIDILIRNIHNYPETNPVMIIILADAQFVTLFKDLLKDITKSDVYKNDLNYYKWDEICFFVCY